MSGIKISEYGISDGQNITGDNNKYLRLLWEVNNKQSGQNMKWVPMAKEVHLEGGMVTSIL